MILLEKLNTENTPYCTPCSFLFFLKLARLIIDVLLIAAMLQPNSRSVANACVVNQSPNKINLISKTMTV